MLKTASAVIVGASSLVGKELADALSSSERVVWELKLLDSRVGAEPSEGARITSAGGEAMLVQPFAVEALAGSDVVFFADEGAAALQYGTALSRSGSAVVDLTGALGGEPGVVTLAPGVGSAHGGLKRVVESAHPVAVMLCTLLMRLRARWPAAHLAATVMVPAAEYGRAGLDALEQQATSLLTFQPAVEGVFDEQSAFNLYVPSSRAAKTGEATITARVLRDIQLVLGNEAADMLAVQIVQAPLFYGYAASVFVGLPVGAAEVRQALEEDDRVLLSEPAEAFSARTAPEDGRTAVAVEQGPAEGVWLWCVCDGLKLAAQNAIACAVELMAAR